MSVNAEQNPVAVIVSRIIERDDVERAKLVIEIERSRAAGGGGWQDDADVRENGIDWRRFWIAFAAQHPGAAALAPVAVVLYFVVILQAIFGS